MFTRRVVAKKYVKGDTIQSLYYTYFGKSKKSERVFNETDILGCRFPQLGYKLLPIRPGLSKILSYRRRPQG